VKQLSVQSNGWDGTFNGALLPADDYWFKVFLEDSRQYSGHFTLKR
jgi:gliding motility-associated-like protein